MARKSTPRIGSVLEMCQSLSTLRDLTLRRDALMVSMEQEIAAVQDKYSADLADLAADAAVEERMLLAWLETNKTLFDTPARSMSYPAGVVGFRLGQRHLKPVSKMTWEKVLSRLLDDPDLEASYIRREPEVNRQALLADATDLGAKLAAIGLRVAQDDKPFIEIRREPDPESKES